MAQAATLEVERALRSSFLPAGGQLPADVWQRRHAGILALVWLHAAIIPVFALVRGYGVGHTVLEAAVVPLIGIAAVWPGTSRRTRSIVASVALLMSSAVLVHLSGGVIEMHFHFFVMVAAVALYQDWAPFVTAVAFVFLHHGVVGVIDPSGVYNHGAAIRSPWEWAAIHAFFISGISAVCLVTWRASEHTLAERGEAEDRLRSETHIVETLNDVGRVLAAELDTRKVVQRVTDAATSVTNAAFGAFFYNVVNDDGEAYMLYTLSGAPLEAFAGFGLPRNTKVFSPTFAGEGVVRLDDVTADGRYGQNPPHQGMPEGHIPVRSYLAVPVRSRSGEVLGGLFFGHPEPARFTVDDERLVVGIAAQAAVAIDNSRLYESEREARSQAETARDTLALLTEASRAMAESLELDAVLRGVADVVVERLADACFVDLLGEDGSVTRVASAGRTDLDPQLEGSSGMQSLATMLVGRQRVLGTLTVASAPDGDRPLGPDAALVVEELGRRTAVAVENAQLFGRQRTVAETLQHGFLPDRLPDIPGVEAAARYLPGADVEVGGDWYDVLQLPGGELSVTMGDVVGRGERAAALMGQIRNAIRAYALDGKAPADIATAVNALLLDAGAEHMATVVYGVLDIDGSEFRYVNAGHPPPLVIDHTGSSFFLETAGGVPLGATQAALYREHRCSFPAGTTLILYTDGLVEDRAEAIDEGLARLRATAGSARGPLDDLCAQIVGAAHGGRAMHDDTAVLAVRVQKLGRSLRLELPAEPAVLTPLRAALRRWLLEAGASPQELYELQVAVGEAASNAIRHAGGGPGSTFVLEGLIHPDGLVELAVEDQGRWRHASRGEGGRGLSIIETFVDALDIDKTDGGTTVRLRRQLAGAEAAAG